MFDADGDVAAGFLVDFEEVLFKTCRLERGTGARDSHLVGTDFWYARETKFIF